MEYYTKGENVEQSDDKASVPFAASLPTDFTWMRVRAGSKLKNLLGVADKALKEEGSVVISGYGPALAKVVSVAEIVKRRNVGCQQYNDVSFRTVEEYWDPKEDLGLSPLKVVREMPQMHIALSRAPLADPAAVGQEAFTPQGNLKEFLDVPQNAKPRNKRRRPKPKEDGGARPPARQEEGGRRRQQQQQTKKAEASER